MKRNVFKYLTLGGVIGPVLFTLISVLSAYLQTHYDWLDSFVSELGATNSSTELLMNGLGFIPSGILFSLFGISLLNLVSEKLSSKIGALSIVVFGLGMTLAGIFSCDPSCPPSGTLESIIHGRVSALTVFSAILGMLLFGISFKKMNTFKNISIFSMLIACITVILMIIMQYSIESRNLTGLWQRLLLVAIFSWTIIVGFRAFKNFDTLNVKAD